MFKVLKCILKYTLILYHKKHLKLPGKCTFIFWTVPIFWVTFGVSFMTISYQTLNLTLKFSQDRVPSQSQTSYSWYRPSPSCIWNTMTSLNFHNDVIFWSCDVISRTIWGAILAKSEKLPTMITVLILHKK